VGYEDASRANIRFLLSLADMLESMEVAFIRYADTVGVLTPSLTSTAIGAMRAHTSTPIGLHAHNDLGMAAANSLAAAQAGARYIDVTLFGIGERAGNCDLKLFARSAGRLYDFKPDQAELSALEEQAAAVIRPAGKIRAFSR
jgi:homocitrate synthase NifV